MRSTKRQEYMRQYYQEHKEKMLQNSREYQERKKLGIRLRKDLEEFYETIDELKEAELQGEGKINWEKWDELVKVTKEQLEDNTYKTDNVKLSRMRYVFNATSGKLLTKDTDVIIASEYAIPIHLVRSYCSKQQFVKYRDLLFSNEWIPSWTVKHICHPKRQSNKNTNQEKE